ncbi:hypothetical protein LSAT2_008975 [Lamellibrachia satsuma]|nr:hypothetical protein LSAT2_008975 [Lamellibrachia satsuma]
MTLLPTTVPAHGAKGNLPGVALVCKLHNVNFAIVTLPSLDTANQCASNPCVNDGVCIDGDYKYECLCIPGYRGTTCEITPPPPHETGGQCANRLDVVVVLDSSQGVTESNFKRSLSFVDAVAREVGVRHDFVRFGMITFATQPRLAFHVGDYVGDLEGLSYAIMTARYQPGKTNTALAIRYARNVMFRRRNGDRPDVKNALLLITEGQSNLNRGLSPREAAQARQAGIVVMGVGVGLKTDGIRNIVGEEWKLVLVKDYLALMEVALQVSILICKEGSP